jgi:hypothetical protein
MKAKNINSLGKKQFLSNIQNTLPKNSVQDDTEIMLDSLTKEDYDRAFRLST